MNTRDEIGRFQVEMAKKEVRYAGFWSRLGANMIDGGLLVLVGSGFLVLPMLGQTFSLLSYLAVTVSYPLYETLLHGRYGQTLGKKILGMRVLDLHHQRIGYGRAARRAAVLWGFAVVNVVGVLLGFARIPELTREASMQQPATFENLLNLLGFLFAIAEVVAVLTNPQRRSLQDLVGGTVVVKGIPQ